MVPSPWGPLRVADAHVHFFSHHFFSLLAGQKPGLTIEAIGSALGWQMPPADPAKIVAFKQEEAVNRPYQILGKVSICRSGTGPLRSGAGRADRQPPG